MHNAQRQCRLFPALSEFSLADCDHSRSLCVLLFFRKHFFAVLETFTHNAASARTFIFAMCKFLHVELPQSTLRKVGQSSGWELTR